MEQEVLNIAHMISHVENQDQEAPALLTNYEEPFVAPPRPPRPPPPGPGGDSQMGNKCII